MKNIGKIHSIQPFGTVDGPGVRIVIFMQGCNLRCGYCHNPDSQCINSGQEFTVNEIFEKIKSFKSYFGKDGGVTVSGGEPLLQAEFVKSIFKLCKEHGINTCLDTSGTVFNENVVELLNYTDYVLLDIKFTNEFDYRKYTTGSYKKVIDFLEFLDNHDIKTRIRQVIVPGLNNNEENISRLKSLKSKFSCVDFIELLPFKKHCKEKYDSLGINFSFDIFVECSDEIINDLYDIMKKEES